MVGEVEVGTMDDRSDLSVALIVRDEAENLPHCLKSIAFARQIVVVDSGSRDETLRIASDFGCDVYVEPWRGFGPQKQFAVEQCREPWILVLDADERIPPETARAIRQKVAAPAGETAGYSFPRKNFFQGRWIRHAGWWPDRVVRLFRNGRGRLTPVSVHEAMMVDGPVASLEVPIEHWTESDLGAILRKIDRYSTLGAKEAFAAGCRSTVGSALLRSEMTFLQDYLLRGGFLDGPQGLTLAVTDAVNKFFKYAKRDPVNRRPAGVLDGAPPGGPGVIRQAVPCLEMAGRMEISVIIVNWNTRELLLKCLESVAATLRGILHEVIVVDNASTDGSVALLKERFPAVIRIENTENRGFGAANNQALAIMKGRYALLLNSDAVLTEHAAAELLACLESRPDAAMACGQLLNADGSRQNSIAAFPSLLTLPANMPLLEFLFPRRFPGKRHTYTQPIEVDSGVGACLMVRREAIAAVGGFDERYFFFFEETDWAYRMRQAGWKILYVPGAFIYHLQGQSIGHHIRSRIEFYRSRYQFFRKWRKRPYYLAVRGVILLRLVLNWLLTLAAALLTLGQKRELREKSMLYGRLLLWHLRGCP
jgi:GT2 family glycosyltransferase